MKKNVASQKIGVQMITAADGTVFTGSVTVYITLDAGTQAIGTVGSGVCTHEGNGYHTYAPSQAETNGDLVAFTFIGTGAVASTIQVYTGFPQTVDNATEIAKIPKSDSTVTWNATALASINTQCDTALTDYDAPTNTEMVAAFTEIKGATWASGTDTLELIRDKLTDIETDTAVIGAAGAGLTALATAASLATAQADLDILTGTNGVTLATSQPNYAPNTTTPPTAGAIADAVWDEALSGHTTAGTTGKAVTDIEADTNELQTDDYPTLIGQVETDTQDIQTRLPAALVSGRMSSDAVAISGSTTAADQLEASALRIVSGTAQTGTLSTTVMTTDLTEATTDHYKGRVIIWTSGVLVNQATDITAYSGTNGTLTYTAITEAPSNGDTFIII